MDEKELNKKVEDLEHQGQRLQFQIRSLKGQSQQIRKQAEEIEEWIRQQQDPSHNQW